MSDLTYKDIHDALERAKDNFGKPPVLTITMPPRALSPDTWRYLEEIGIIDRENA